MGTKRAAGRVENVDFGKTIWKNQGVHSARGESLSEPSCLSFQRTR